mmetsp:Transcript_13599/g.23562  ORF Transcript_13599/g.23562 Transcript_13599/m.23562 type:complete len:318 (-) Transcript_13599:539-1492(-)
MGPTLMTLMRSSAQDGFQQGLHFLHVFTELRHGAAIETLDLLDCGDVMSVGDEVYGKPFLAKPAGSPYSMEIRLHVFRPRWQIVVHHNCDGRHVDAARQHISGDQHSGDLCAELIHHLVPLGHIDVAFRRSRNHAHSMALVLHLTSQSKSTFPCVDKNDALTDIHDPVQVRQQCKFLVLMTHVVSTHVDERLCDGSQRQVFFFNLDRVRPRDHRLRQLGDVVRPSGRKKQNLQLFGKHSADVKNLPTHATRTAVALVEHLVCLINDQHLECFRIDDSFLEPILQLSRRANDHLRGDIPRSSLLFGHSQEELQTCEFA